MNSHRVIFWLLMLSGWIAFQTIGTSSAHASCGDYLVGTHHLRSADTVAHDIPNWDGQQHSTPVPISKPPYNGPDCQKNRQVPIAPVPAKINLTDHDRLGCLASAMTLPKREAADFLFVEHVLHSIGHPPAIDHPPRA